MTCGLNLSPEARKAPDSHWRRWMVAVLILAAIVGGASSAQAAAVNLSWNAPTTNATGSALTDLAGYRIYIGTAQPTCPAASFHSVSSPVQAPAAGTTVSQRIVGLTANTTYFVRVTAVDLAGNESACSSAASGVALADFGVNPSTTVTFGSVTTGTSVDRSFTVQNTSASSLTVAVSVGAPYSITSGGSLSLASGASQAVTVRFRPTAPGSFATNVNFAANGDTIARTVTGSATGSTLPSTTPTTPPASTSSGITATPSQLSFTGTQIAPATVRVTTSSNQAWSTRDTCPWGDVTGGTARLSSGVSGPSGGTFAFTPNRTAAQLSSGTHSCDVTISSAGAPDLIYKVLLTVGAPASTQSGTQITATPSQLSFTGTQTAPATVRVTTSSNQAWSTSDTCSWGDVTGGTAWLGTGVSGPSGGTFLFTPNRTVAQLPRGTYSCDITISSAGAPNRAYKAVMTK
jgi:hypothetical protein